jgi:ferritin
MKTTKEHHALLAKLEEAGRGYQGLWSAFSNSKPAHHGLAAFAAYEAAERQKYATKIAQHLAEHGQHVQFGAIPAPACDYDNPLMAMDAACKMDDETMHAAVVVHDAIIDAGERPYFLGGLIQDLERDRKEVYEVKSMLQAATTPEQMTALNKHLLQKYTNA